MCGGSWLKWIVIGSCGVVVMTILMIYIDRRVTVATYGHFRECRPFGDRIPELATCGPVDVASRDSSRGRSAFVVLFASQAIVDQMCANHSLDITPREEAGEAVDEIISAARRAFGTAGQSLDLRSDDVLICGTIRGKRQWRVYGIYSGKSERLLCNFVEADTIL